MNTSDSAHWMPPPEYLAAQQQQQQQKQSLPQETRKQSLEQQQQQQQRQQQQQNPRFEEFLNELDHVDDNNNYNNNAPNKNNQPTSILLPPKRSRLEEFTIELKELLLDLLEYSRAKTWKKKVLAVTLCLSSILVFSDLLFGHYIVTWLHAFMVWMTVHSIEAVFAFVAIFVVATLIFIPPTLLVFGAGYAFTVTMDSVWMGICAAAISCFMGSWIGAVIAFLRARYMMRDLIYLFARRYPLVRAADRALKTKGFRIMILLRLCPILPFNGLNYCCGITGVSLHDFCTSLVGILPFHVYTIVLGATAGVFQVQNLKNPNSNKNENQHITFIVLIVTGVLFGLIAMVYAWRLVKKELKRELDLTSEEFEYLIHPNRMSESNVDAVLHEHEEYQLQDSNDSSSEASIEVTPTAKYLQEDEEWFWVWA